MSNNNEEAFSQTPLYRALQSDRYARQQAISSIEKITKRQLIVYEANLWSSRSSLGEEDIQPFGDLLVRVTPKQNVDLLLQSPDGAVFQTSAQSLYICIKKPKNVHINN